VPLGVIQEVHRARAFARAKRKKGQACRQALHSIACAPSVRSRRQNKKNNKKKQTGKTQCTYVHVRHTSPCTKPPTPSLCTALPVKAQKEKQQKTNKHEKGNKQHRT
jgi:hypothetical protein